MEICLLRGFCVPYRDPFSTYLLFLVFLLFHGIFRGVRLRRHISCSVLCHALMSPVARWFKILVVNPIAAPASYRV